MNIAWIGGRPGIWELLIVFLAIVLLFGARKIPELARSLGKSLSEFKKGRADGTASDSGDDSDNNDQSSPCS